jgi:hypothetical protein
VYNTSHNATQRQLVEGYLAWKWSIQNYLPSNHLYKNAPPQVPAPPPKVLLRAKNYSGTGPWLDESGYNNNATLENGTNTKNAANNGLVLDGSTNWTFPNVAVGNNWSVNIWYKKTGAEIGSQPCILSQIFTGTINLLIGYNIGNPLCAGFFGGDFSVGSAISLISGAWTNIQATWDGTNLSTYINSTLIGTTTPGTTAVDSGAAYRIGRRWDEGDYVVGEIGEVRIYNYARNQRQVTEDYISSYNTFLFNPSTISGNKLWLDAADASTLTVDGVNVSQWSDKSTNEYNETIVGYPTYINNAIRITPGNFVKISIAPGAFIQAFNAFLVYKALANTPQNTIITRNNSITDPNLGNPLDMQLSEYFIGENNAAYFKNSYECFNPNQSIFNININQVTQETISFSVFSNGQQATDQYESRGGTGIWVPSDLGDTVTIGGRVDGSSQMNATYNEVLIFNKVLTTGERQAVEGYLAWKWSLQSQLVNTHPYYAAPPQTNALV